MIRKSIFALAALLLAACLGGCSSGGSASGSEPPAQEIQRLARVEILQDGEDTLLGAVEEKDALLQFQDCFDLQSTGSEEEQSGWEQESVGLEPFCSIAVYQSPAAILNDGALELLMTATLYENSGIVRVQVAPEAIKGSFIASEHLVSYYTIPSEKMDALRAFVAEHSTLS